MPPKSSPAGSRRRATRSTARKSVRSPLFIKSCSAASHPSPDPLPDTVYANVPTADDDIAISAANDSSITTITRASTASVEDGAGEERRNEGDVGAVEAFGLLEENRENPGVEVGVVMVSHETLAQQRPLDWAAIEGHASPGPSGTDGKVAGDDVPGRIEAVAEEAIEAAQRDVVVSGGEGGNGKKKKVVKKVVKVVKKVVKRVPKMVSYENLAQQRPIDCVAIEGHASPGPSGTDGKIASDDVPGRIEAVAEEGIEVAERDVVVSGGEGGNGKTKNVVKKVVKVVKKVVKRVPKRATKGGNEDEKNHDDKEEDEKKNEKREDEKNKRSENYKKDDENDDEKVDHLTKDVFPVPMQNLRHAEHVVTSWPNVGDPNADVAPAMAVEKAGPDKETAKRDEMGTEESKSGLKAQYGEGSVSMEVDPNEDILKVQQLKAAGDKRTQEPLDAKGGEDVQCRSGTSDVDTGRVEVGGEGEVENSDNTVRHWDEVGGVHLSTEMEAVERQKRRKTEIFVGGLDRDTKEEDIRKVFEEVGDVVEVRLLMSCNTGKNKGYAFVRYASAVDAKKAAKQFSKVEICGKQCGTSLVEGSDTLYLGNIDKKWKDEDVLKLLHDAGVQKIDKVTVMGDTNSHECNRGFAFIEFETSKAAQVALKKLQKKDAFGKNKKLKVAWAQPLTEPDEEEMLKVKTIFAEFIPPEWDEEILRERFKEFGEIEKIVLACNLRTSKRKDFAFINYKTREAAIACVESFRRALANDDGTKECLKVSLAKPIMKGKHLKKVSKLLNGEIPKETTKPSRGTVKLVDPRNQGRLIIPQHDSYVIQRPSTNAELVQLLREQAALRPLQNTLNSSSGSINYTSSLSARKRPFSALEADPYSDLREHAHSYLETSFPIAGSSNHSFSSVGGVTSSSYYQSPEGYASQLPSGPRNYVGSEARERTDGRGFLYHRY